MSPYSLKPQEIDANTWFYDYPGGLYVVHEARGKADDKHIQTDQFLIRWRAVRAALAWHDAPPRPKRAKGKRK